MKLYHFWAKMKHEIDCEGEPTTITCYAGSNESLKDALVATKRQALRIQNRIAGTPIDEELYEVAIREEITDVINEQNMVTRTRYGALVLNSEDLVFIDIDELPQPIMQRLAAMFGLKEKLSPVAQLKQLIETQREKTAYRNTSMRAYQTCKGFRLIVTGGDFKANTAATNQLLEDFHCDRLYQYFCNKQSCFRARLTPKPYRMKCETHKVIFPRENQQQENALANWVKTYDQHRQAFNTCRLIESYGPAIQHPALAYHDRITGAEDNKRLA